MCFWGAGAELSALERALEEEGQDISEDKEAPEYTGYVRADGPERASAGNAGISLEGTVYKVEEKAKVTAVYMKDNVVSAASQKFNESKIMVYIRPDHTEIKIGNKVKISGEASAFEPARNPGNFDQRAYYVRQGIHVLVWAEDVEILSDETDQVQQFLSELRAGWQKVLIEHLGEYYGGTMSAILLGDKSGLDAEMKKLYQKNGIGHLLAISGLHMSFIGMGIYSLLRRSGLGFIPAGTAGGVILILYTIMIGAGVSSLRALIMFLVRVGADMTGRDYDLATSLALAAAVLCWRQPLYITDAGFLLSFGAILGLVLLSPVFAEMLRAEERKETVRKNGRVKGRIKTGRGKAECLKVGSVKAGQWLAGGLASSLSVNLLLLGPVLYFYFEIPPYSVLLNLLVIPVMPVAMGAGITGSILALLSGPAGGAVLKICGVVLWSYDQLCAAAGMLPGSRFVTGKPCAGWLIVYYLILGCLTGLFYYLYRKREAGDSKGNQAKESGKVPKIFSEDRYHILIRLPGCALVLCAVLMTLTCRFGYHNTDGIEAAVLDVGQGDSIHIRGREGNHLIDGGSSDVSSAGIYRIEPYLLANAVDTLDYVFATHGDEDHINGLLELLEGQDLGIRVCRLVLPPEEYHEEKLEELARTAQENGTKVLVMQEGDVIAENTGKGKAPEAEDLEKAILTLTCLGPEEGREIEPGNGASLVLDLSYGDFHMLLTGDVEGKGEKSLCENDRLRQYDVLKAAHHGSRNSGTEEFLQITRPSIALISAGVDNRYGHPHTETLERLGEAGCRVYSTQENGMLTVWTDGEMMELRGYLSAPGLSAAVD